MDERAFMDIIRRALLMIVRAIEKRYGLGAVFRPGKDDTVTGL